MGAGERNAMQRKALRWEPVWLWRSPGCWKDQFLESISPPGFTQLTQGDQQDQGRGEGDWSWCHLVFSVTLSLLPPRAHGPLEPSSGSTENLGEREASPALPSVLPHPHPHPQRPLPPSKCSCPSTGVLIISGVLAGQVLSWGSWPGSSPACYPGLRAQEGRAVLPFLCLLLSPFQGHLSWGTFLAMAGLDSDRPVAGWRLLSSYVFHDCLGGLRTWHWCMWPSAWGQPLGGPPCVCCRPWIPCRI